MSDRYLNEAQQRVLKLVVLMAGHEFDGVAPSALAKALDTNPSNITRDLANLAKAGFAERIGDSDRWRLGPKVVQIAVSALAGMESISSRVSEYKQRYTVQR
ncbi:MAG: IclR family transcriptional regulator [Azonexus sp.]